MSGQFVKILPGLFICLTSLAQAESGFLVGMSGGVGWLSGKQNDRIDNPGALPLIWATNQSMHEKSGLGILTLGYQRIFSQKYSAAVEFFGGLSNFQKSLTETLPDPIITRFKRQSFLGTAFRIGRVFEAVTPYLKAGVQWEGTEHTFQELDNGNVRQNRSHRSFKPAFLMGLGIARSLGKHFSVRLEYTCSLGTSVKRTFVDMDGGNVTQQLKNPRTQAVTLGAFYHF